MNVATQDFGEVVIDAQKVGVSFKVRVAPSRRCAEVSFQLQGPDDRAGGRAAPASR